MKNLKDTLHDLFAQAGLSNITGYTMIWERRKPDIFNELGTL